MLIARTEPYLVYYHPGYCRLSLKKYTTSSESLDDPTVHLTNASVQKKDPLYEANKDMQIQSVADVADKVEQNGDVDAANFMRNDLDETIMQCMVDVFKAAMPKFSKKKGYFDLLGFDFMISTDRKLLLLEVNTNPAMSLDNSVLENLLPGVIDGTIELVLRSQGPPGGNSTGKDAHNVHDDAPGSFKLLFDQEKGFEYQSTMRAEAIKTGTKRVVGQN
jgi:tubulin--tyrosine ligase like protein 10